MQSLPQRPFQQKQSDLKEEFTPKEDPTPKEETSQKVVPTKEDTSIENSFVSQYEPLIEDKIEDKEEHVEDSKL